MTNHRHAETILRVSAKSDRRLRPCPSAPCICDFRDDEGSLRPAKCPLQWTGRDVERSAGCHQDARSYQDGDSTTFGWVAGYMAIRPPIFWHLGFLCPCHRGLDVNGDFKDPDFNTPGIMQPFWDAASITFKPHLFSCADLLTAYGVSRDSTSDRVSCNCCRQQRRHTTHASGIQRLREQCWSPLRLPFHMA